MKSVKSKLSVLLVFAAFGLTACGSDSTGPSNLDAASALKSLELGIQRLGAVGTTGTLVADESFGGIAPFLNQVTVDIGGSSQTMFGLALHESFPEGTCWETIFGNIIPADPNACTPPPLGLALLLWQAHSPSELPDRLILIAGDVGTSDFSFDIDSEILPAIAVLMEGEHNLWLSESGTLTSAVSATQSSCSVPLPLYAKSGHCNIANFDEQGSIVLAAADDEIYGPSPSSARKTLTIPRQALHGLWMVVTEVQPIGLTATRLTPRGLLNRVAGAR